MSENAKRCMNGRPFGDLLDFSRTPLTIMKMNLAWELINHIKSPVGLCFLCFYTDFLWKNITLLLAGCFHYIGTEKISVHMRARECNRCINCMYEFFLLFEAVKANWIWEKESLKWVIALKAHFHMCVQEEILVENW